MFSQITCFRGAIEEPGGHGDHFHVGFRKNLNIIKIDKYKTIDYTLEYVIY